MNSLIVGAATVLVATYVGVGALLYTFQDRLMFQPGPPPPPPSETPAPELTPVTVTTADGLDLMSWYAPPPPDGRGRVVVYFHGNAGTLADRAHKARALLDRGLGVMLVGYRGYNGNPGDPSEAGFREDGRAALAFLEAQGFGPEQRVHYGESIGSGTALPLAVEAGAAAVVLEGGFTSMRAVAQGQYPLYPAGLLVRHPFDNVAAVQSLKAPLLVLHGEHDDLVPVAMGRRLLEIARAAGNPRAEGVFFPDGNHVDLIEHGAMERLVRFLDTLPPPPASAPVIPGGVAR
ncbi:prolyl oligopeptidase family serine peptidase [Roseospira marina]|uniref:Prolyl oligopeptidase family serine peptidase n=1 Tax=Roseospira marina TaxID=140057 RepID=A0A5M6I9E4_9PROT|nr:prolyl oligopeptidase family serine peptidase [Roseospira marina]KAA5604851.1 prolyl oligopeptidase family serine peptidase [Roseospira marina]MBB4315184.1 hypothetical protein [Roseospira marina]MBB5088184.1 hypothetical protein [Roseospira marina]